MNYHMIRTDDMLNGDGLRVIIFLSGCEHHCEGCHNPETWDINSGKTFTDEAAEEIIQELNKPYISGVTFSGGDPLHQENLLDIYNLICRIKDEQPYKNIWLYTGYIWEDIYPSFKHSNTTHSDGKKKTDSDRRRVVNLCDVLVDGKFIKTLADVNCPWVGSTNQRVIDVQESLLRNKIVLYNYETLDEMKKNEKTEMRH